MRDRSLLIGTSFSQTLMASVLGMLAYCLSGACAVFAAREMLERMMLWSLSYWQYTRHRALFLFTYAFLLRLPSEALPVVCGRVSGDNGQARLYKGDNTLVLTLERAQWQQACKGLLVQ